MKLGIKHVYGLIKAMQTKIIYFLQLLIKKKKPVFQGFQGIAWPALSYLLLPSFVGEKSLDEARFSSVWIHKELENMRRGDTTEDWKPHSTYTF